MSSPAILIVAPDEAFALLLTNDLHQTLHDYPVQVVYRSVDALLALTTLSIYRQRGGILRDARQ